MNKARLYNLVAYIKNHISNADEMTAVLYQANKIQLERYGMPLLDRVLCFSAEENGIRITEPAEALWNEAKKYFCDKYYISESQMECLDLAVDFVNEHGMSVIYDDVWAWGEGEISSIDIAKFLPNSDEIIEYLRG